MEVGLTSSALFAISAANVSRTSAGLSKTVSKYCQRKLKPAASFSTHKVHSVMSNIHLKVDNRRSCGVISELLRLRVSKKTVTFFRNDLGYSYLHRSRRRILKE
jgi:hypothetical protein